MVRGFKTFHITLQVSRNWIEDGFNPTADDIEEAIGHLLPYAFEEEIKVKIIQPKEATPK